MKTFMIGKDRSLKLGKNNDGLIIRKKGSKNESVFTPARWASFRLCQDVIDNQLYRLSQGEDVAYCTTCGGRCNETLSSPIAYVSSSCVVVVVRHVLAL